MGRTILKTTFAFFIIFACAVLATSVLAATATTSTTTSSSTSVKIVIPPIPELQPDQTFVMPVTITGNGTYNITIPRLAWAYYEMPSPVTVKTQTTVPILIHIRPDAQADTYIIPVTVGTESASARIRILRYTERTSSTPWMLVAIGIGLIIAACIIVFANYSRNRREPPRARTFELQDDDEDIAGFLKSRREEKTPKKDTKESNEKENDESDTLITYY